MSDSRPNSTPNASTDPTIGKLVADASRDLSALVRSEIQLAKTELKVSVTSGGLATVFVLIAAFLGLLLIIMLSITLAYFLTMTGLHPAWAFLIVSGLYIVTIVALCVGAYLKFKKIRVPEQTIATAKAIPQAFKS
ncbi:MAG TPA: phage holin family protein [Aeromicrobium sp.]|nr:phage holin family protein [Aeromicrobium sp.]